MNTQVIPFENHQIQVVEAEVNGKVQRAITLREISNAIGIDQGSIRKLLTRNKELFEGLKGWVKTSTPGGEQMVNALTRDGVIALMVKLSAGHVTPEKRQMISNLTQQPSPLT